MSPAVCIACFDKWFSSHHFFQEVMSVVNILLLTFPILVPVALPSDTDSRKPYTEPTVNRTAHASSDGFPTGYE